MIGYFFVNRNYMKEVQWGIQALHCAVDMSLSQRLLSNTSALVWNEWAVQHKTVIILDGGNVASLRELEVELGRLSYTAGLPFGSFYEDEESLGGVITCVGVIATPDIIEYNTAVRGKLQQEIDMISADMGLSPERQLVADIIRRHKLA